MSDISLETAAGDNTDRVLVVDIMALFQTMKKTSTMLMLVKIRATFYIENDLRSFALSVPFYSGIKKVLIL